MFKIAKNPKIIEKNINFFFFFCVHRNYLESICKKKMARCVSPTLNSDFIEAQLKMQDELQNCDITKYIENMKKNMKIFFFGILFLESN